MVPFAYESSNTELIRDLKLIEHPEGGEWIFQIFFSVPFSVFPFSVFPFFFFLFSFFPFFLFCSLVGYYCWLSVIQTPTTVNFSLLFSSFPRLPLDSCSFGNRNCSGCRQSAIPIRVWEIKKRIMEKKSNRGFDHLPKAYAYLWVWDCILSTIDQDWLTGLVSHDLTTGRTHWSMKWWMAKGQKGKRAWARLDSQRTRLDLHYVPVPLSVCHGHRPF